MSQEIDYEAFEKHFKESREQDRAIRAAWDKIKDKHPDIDEKIQELMPTSIQRVKDRKKEIKEEIHQSSLN